jgi:hypothetical protein
MLRRRHVARQFFSRLKSAGMREGLVRTVYIVTATKNGQTEFWAAATSRHRAAAAVQRLLPSGWSVMCLGWRLSPTKAAALKLSSNSVRRLISSTAIDGGLLLSR